MLLLCTTFEGINKIDTKYHITRIASHEDLFFTKIPRPYDDPENTSVFLANFRTKIVEI